MSERNGHLAAIDTRPYQGRQTTTQDIEEAIRRKAAAMTGKAKRDAWLGVALTVQTLLLAASVMGNVWQGMDGIREVPYVALVDQFGQERPVLRLADEMVTPEQSIVMSVLMSWLEMVRPISNDPAVLGKNWEKAEDYMSNALIQRISEFRADQKGRQEQGLRVELTSPPSVMPIAGSTRSFSAEWEEMAYDVGGRPVPYESGRWKATLTVADFQSTAAQQEKALRRKKRHYRNLLAIVVDDVQWTYRPLLSQIQPPEEGR